jgi:hypothetical protein
MHDRNHLRLSRNQQIFAATLREDWLPLSDCLLQAGRDGWVGQKMHYRRLRSSGIMDMKLDEKGVCLVKRGPEWTRFYEQYGLDVTEDCLGTIGLWEAIDVAWGTCLVREG